MPGQSPIVMSGGNDLEGSGVLSNIATEREARNRAVQSQVNQVDIFPASIETKTIHADTVRIGSGLLGSGNSPLAHITAAPTNAPTDASTSHSISDFATANSAADTLGGKINSIGGNVNTIGARVNSILVALEAVHITASS